MSAPALKHLKLEDVDGVAVVDFVDSGLMFETALVQDIGEELQSLADRPGHTRILLDFDHVQYLSSTMLAQLAKLAKERRESEGPAQAHRPGPGASRHLPDRPFRAALRDLRRRASALKAFRRPSSTGPSGRARSVPAVASRPLTTAPAIGAMKYISVPVAQLDRASASGAEGCRFKSCRAYPTQRSLTRTRDVSPGPSCFLAP